MPLSMHVLVALPGVVAQAQSHVSGSPACSPMLRRPRHRSGHSPKEHLGSCRCPAACFGLRRPSLPFPSLPCSALPRAAL
eukprot:355653-Chlamydomonas_euryale.AAC.1